MSNKVKFGLKNVTVFPITDETSTKTTYGAAIKIPGAVSLSLKAEGGSEKFFADDTNYWEEFSNNGYSGDLEVALLPDEYKIQIMGQKKDNNGALFENQNDKMKPFALAFEFSGDKKKTRHIMYRCNASRPDVNGKTIDEKKAPETDKLSINCSADLISGDIKASVKEGETGYDTFYDAPYVKGV